MTNGPAAAGAWNPVENPFRGNSGREFQGEPGAKVKRKRRKIRNKKQKASRRKNRRK